MTNSRSSLEALLARVEAAEGPNDELSAQVLSALLSEEPVVAVERSPINGVWCAYVMGHGGRRRLWDAPSPFRQMNGVTASLDAALALVERAAPNLSIENLGEMAPGCGEQSGHWLAQLRPRVPRQRMSGPITPENVRSTLDGFETVSAKIPALALLAALLKALIADEGVSA